MNTFYNKTRKASRFFIRLFFRIRVVGTPIVPEGPYILCSNHLSAVDMFFLAYGIEKQIHFLAKAEAFSLPFFGSFVKKLGAIPVHRGETDIHALKAVISLLKEDKLVGIFPQGTRISGREASPEQAKSGIALLANRGKAGIIPAFIQTKNNKIRLFRPVTVYFGTPIPNEALGFESGSVSEYNRITESVFAGICALPSGGKDVK